MREPQALGASGGKTGEARILDFVSAQPLLIEMGKDRVATGIHPNPARKTPGCQYRRWQTTLVLQVGVPQHQGRAMRRRY